MSKSYLSKIHKDDLQTIVNKHNSISAILRELNISETCPYNRNLLKGRMSSDIDITIFEQNKVNKNPFSNGVDHVLNDNDYFSIGDKRRAGCHIKTRLIKHKNWKDICSVCGLGTVWNNLPISLHVDHINGNSFDNTLENLRFICPNCHSQTETFGSKNRK
jgi:hypothetical protein